MEIDTFLTISTAHVSNATREALDNGEMPFTVWSADYGWFLYAKHVENGSTSFMAETPADLVAAMRYAVAAGVAWLRFDIDGPEVEGLETFDM